MKDLLNKGFQSASETEMVMVEGGYTEIDSEVIPPDWCEPHLPPPSGGGAGGGGNSYSNQ